MENFKAKHLKFTKCPNANAYLVYNKHDLTLLGSIEWCDKKYWNCMAFFPLPDRVFEEDCLRDIARFCEEYTKEIIITKEMK